MNRSFATVAIATFFGSALVCVADEAAFSAGDAETFFKRPAVTTALFTQSSDTGGSLPNRVVGFEYAQSLANNEATGKAVSQQPTKPGNDLSFLDQSREDPKPPESVNHASTLLWQLAAVLAFAVIVGAVVLIKKAPHRLAAVDTGQLTIVGTLSLSHRSVVHLIAVGDTRVVVASDATGVKSLIPLPQPFDKLLDTELDPVEAPYA